MWLEFNAAQASTASGTSRPVPVDDVLTTPWRWICSIQVDYPEKVFHSPGGVPKDESLGCP